MDSLHSCPLCEFGSVLNSELEEHMLSHSKESLVNFLLQKSAGSSFVDGLKSDTDGNSLPAHSKLVLVKHTASGVRVNAAESREYNPGETTLELRKICTETPTTSKTSTNKSPSRNTRGNATVKIGLGSCSHENLKLDTRARLTCGETAMGNTSDNLNLSETGFGINAESMVDMDSISRTAQPVEVKVAGETEIVEGGVYTIMRAISLDAENAVNEVEPARGSDVPLLEKATYEVMAANVPSVVNSTATIKYIIENNGTSAPVSHEEQYIIVDGRFIPVYNCNNTAEAQIVTLSKTDVNAGDSMSESLSLKSGCSNLDVDLMTDEEIPPKGEISEFEESSTSFMSDDINVHCAFSEQMAGTAQHSTKKIFVSSGALNVHDIAFRRVNANRDSSAITTSTEGCQEACSKKLSNKSPTKISSFFQMIKLERIAGEQDESSEAEIQEIGQSPGIQYSDSSVPEQKFKVPSLPEKKTKAGKLYFCIYCEWTSSTKSGVASHTETSHPGKSLNPDSFECATCGKMFETRPSLRKHLAVHRQRKYVCSTCHKAFPSNYKLQEHIRIHEGVYPYACSQCGKNYRTPSLLATHEKRQHPKSLEEKYEPKKTEFMCPVCHRIIHSKRNLQSHLLLHKQKPVKCPHCSETYARQSVLVRHIRVCHDSTYTAPKTKDCMVCGKTFHPNSLKTHMLIHSKEKPHECPVCHKNFRTLGNLNNHSWSHKTSERPFKCPQCPKSYIFNRTLQNHTMVHKKKTFHFVCNECGVKFTNKNNLKRHVEEHRGEKKYECLVCDKKFFRQYYLVEHERIHNGTRPYTCSICGKASSTKSNHLSHIKIHDARESGNLEG